MLSATYQQEMNREYENYIGIMPCDGVYGRNTNKAYIKALQAEMGMNVDTATGNIGSATRRCLPSIPYQGIEKDYNGRVYTGAKIQQFKKMFNFGLYANSFGDGIFVGDINVSAVRQFQNAYGLTITGTVNLETWLSILISSGDNTRKGTACDTRFEITDTNLEILKANGYRIVGRYLTGGSFKEIREGEFQRIFNGGLSVFPIYQTDGARASYFNAEQGAKDALAAEQAARQKGVPRGTIIYFAVDFDALDYNIDESILPHFAALFSTISGYRVGIYAPRNVCSRVADAGYSVSSFVSDMSTGFSGNLGFPLPKNWAFDQISNIYISHNGNSLEIDNNISSGRDQGFNKLAGYADPDEDYSPAPTVMPPEQTQTHKIKQ